MNKINKILIAEKEMKKAKQNYEELVFNYIKTEVDLKSWKSIDKAIMELPESNGKLLIYDAMYDLENNTPTS